MPGVNLNLSLPSLSDSLSTIVSKTAAALSAIQNDLTPKVTAGAININAALPFNGNPATGLGSILLASGNQPSAAGSIYYKNGEFYAIDATGTVQLTSAGAINAAGIGGITGDFGGVNPARVTYVAASGQYQFTSSPGVWATLVAGSVLLEGSAGTVQMGVDAAISGAKTANWKSLPPSGVSVLVYNGATGTIEDGGVTQVTNPLTSTAAIKASDLKFTNQRQLNIPASAGILPSVSAGLTGSKSIVFPFTLPVGAQITGYGFRVYKNTSAAASIYGVLVTATTTGPSSATISNADTGNAVGPGGNWGIALSANNPGLVTMSPALAVGINANDANHSFYLVIQGSDGSTPAPVADTYGAIQKWNLNSGVDWVLYATVYYTRP